MQMADATVVANLPAGLPAYAGYVDGQWVTFPDLPAAPHHLAIATGRTPGKWVAPPDCADIEQGDWTVADAPAALALGMWVLYCSVVRVRALLAYVPREAFKLWTAHYTATLGAHICGPRTCGLSPVTADGTQYVDTGYDLSLLRDDFFTRPLTREEQVGISINDSGEGYAVGAGTRAGHILKVEQKATGAWSITDVTAAVELAFPNDPAYLVAP